MIRNVWFCVLVSLFIINIEIPENNYIENIEYKIVAVEESTNNIFYFNNVKSTYIKVVKKETSIGDNPQFNHLLIVNLVLIYYGFILND